MATHFRNANSLCDNKVFIEYLSAISLVVIPMWLSCTTALGSIRQMGLLKRETAQRLLCAEWNC